MQSFFVSSTFKDMQEERDALHRIVMPRLREEARRFGEAVQFVDLRWGISTGDLDSEAGAARILDVCLDEVKQCRPYMIVLVGDRYGWVPPSSLIHHASEASGYAEEDDDISVTELEIRYSMWLAQGELDHFIFCLREPLDPARLSPEQQAVFLAADPEDRRRMDALREKLAAAPGATVLRYALDPDPETGAFTGCEAFADRLSETILARLLPKWKARAARTWQELQREEDRIIIEGHQATYVGRIEEMRSLFSALSGHQIVVVEGKGGAGKSAFLADLERRLSTKGRTTDPMRCRMFCCGNSAHCMSTLQLMRLMLWALDVPDSAVPAGDTDPIALRDAFRRHMADYAGEPTVLILDAIDQLTPDQPLYESWFLPPRLSRRIRIVISTTDAVKIHPGAIPMGQGTAPLTYFRLDPPDAKDLRTILGTRFRAEHKTVSAAVADRILANPCSRNMLGMELIVRRLVMLDSDDFAAISRLEQTMDGAAAIDSHLLSVLDGLSDNMNGLIIDYFTAAARFINPENYRPTLFCLCLIGLMQHGMSADQMEQFRRFCIEDPVNCDIPKDHIFLHFWDPLAFARTKRYMGSLLLTRGDGRVDFSHRLLREGIHAFTAANAIYPFLPYWLYLQPADDISRLENIAVMGRRYLDILSTEKDATAEKFSVYSSVFLIYPIRDAANLADSDDETQAAEGKRQKDILLRSILSDISGPETQSRVLRYARMIEENILTESMTPNWYVVIFYATELSSALDQRGDAGRIQALPILCAILSALHRVKARIDAGETVEHAADWSPRAMSRFLFYHIRTLRLLADVQEGLKEKQLTLAAGSLSAKEICRRGLALADELIALDPADFVPRLRRAQLHTYMARIAWAQDLTSGRAVRAMDRGIRELREIFRIARKTDTPLPSVVQDMALSLAADIAETQIFLSTKRLFVKTSEAYRSSFELCREIWDAVMARCEEKEIPAEYRIRCRTVMGRCLFHTAMNRTHAADSRQAGWQEAADMLGGCYMQIRREYGLTGEMPYAVQESMGELIAEIGLLLFMQCVPAALAEKDADRCRVARYITNLDGSRTQTLPAISLRSRWIRIMAAATEALGCSDDPRNAARCAAQCRLVLSQIGELRRIANAEKEKQDLAFGDMHGDNRVTVIEERITNMLKKAEKEKSAQKS